MSHGMPRFTELLSTRLAPGKTAEIDAVRRPGEQRQDLVRAAIDREIAERLNQPVED